MVIDKDLIYKKLGILNEYITQIENMDFTASELNKNRDIQDLLAFRLQQAVETAIDVSTHLIAGLSLSREETAKDAFLKH